MKSNLTPSAKSFPLWGEDLLLFLLSRNTSHRIARGDSMERASD